MAHITRETWLAEAVEHLALLYAETTEDGEPVNVPPVVVSVGFALTGGRKTAGTCWVTEAASDGVNQIYISPVYGADDAADVLATLTHELAHAVDDGQSKHGGRFRKLAEGVGLVGPKWTATAASEELLAKFEPILDKLGPYPGAALDIGLATTKPQRNKQEKAECKQIITGEDAVDFEPLAGRAGETCGYQVRTTKKWYSAAIPSCPLHDMPLELEHPEILKGGDDQ